MTPFAVPSFARPAPARPGSPLRILTLHSIYRTSGGEDESYAIDVALLRRAGHEVVELTRRAADLNSARVPTQAVRVVWNRTVAAELTSLIARFSPQVAYVSNTFPALSAACLQVLGRHRVPTVLAVRNFRLSCTTGLLYRDGAHCRSCLGRLPLPAVRHGCYEGRAASTVTAAALIAVRQTLERYAPSTRYMPVSEHLRGFLLRLGVAADLIWVRPETLIDAPPPAYSAGEHLLMVGRWQPEKGLAAAIGAVRATPGMRLVVVGDGSDLDRLRCRGGLADLGSRLELLGRRPHHEVLRLMSTARATLVPSLWDEPFGRVAMESLACGTPVVVGDRGGLREIPEPGVSGLLVDPADPAALAAAVARVQQEPWWADGGRRAARARFDARYAPATVGATLVAGLRAAAAAGTAESGRVYRAR